MLVSLKNKTPAPGISFFNVNKMRAKPRKMVLRHVAIVCIFKGPKFLSGMSCLIRRVYKVIGMNGKCINGAENVGILSVHLNADWFTAGPL